MSERPINIDSMNSIDSIQAHMQNASMSGQSRYSDPLSSKVAHLSDSVIKEIPQPATKEAMADHQVSQQNGANQQTAVAQQFFHGAPQKQMAQEFVKNENSKVSISNETQRSRKGFLFVEEAELDDQKSDKKYDVLDDEEENNESLND
ncbi:MAG: hypothetical protein JHC93_02160 [Parachlamydiales bacterium]|nr:hypothetical protein [Parachlamydiales bacterium]